MSYEVEKAISFNGDSRTKTSQLCKFISAQVQTCQPGSKLDDNDLGGSMGSKQEDSDDSFDAYEKFFAFGRGDKTSGGAGVGSGGAIQLLFPAYFDHAINIVLNFIHKPSSKIGLPQLTLEMLNSTTNLPFVYDDNFDLDMNDATVRNVSLHVELPTDVTIKGVKISMTFPNHSLLDWFLLSEVDVFGELSCHTNQLLHA